MNNFFLVFVGGGLGSLARYGVARLTGTLWNSDLPYATFISNTVSSLILGIVVGLALEKSSVVSAGVRILIVTGFCGGFSTFSSFSYETLELFRSGQFAVGMLNIFFSITVCMLCVWGGMALARFL